MSKTRCFLILCVALCAVAFPVVAGAGLGPHNISSSLDGKALEGACAVCHNVAATAATRGWGRTITDCTTGWFTQGITVLCWTCHSSSLADGAHDVTTTAMSTNNHSYVKANTPPPALNPSTRQTASVSGSALPYVAGANLQCTSCHNVHNDAFAPFIMKPTIRTLCDSCHPGRNYATVRGANTAGTDNCSVHPVNIALDNAPGGTTMNASIKAVANIDAALKLAMRAGDNTWILGGHLENGATGDLSCETCHAVHGKVTLTGVNDLLSIDNKQPSTTADRTSPLCEGCHYGGDATGSVGSPGTTDHPLDSNSGRFGFYPTGVAIPGDWDASSGRLDRPASGFWDNGTLDTPRCSSCHDAHGGLSGKSLLRSPIPSAAGGEWCFSCHTGSQVAPPMHHSALGNYSSSKIACSGCHGSTLAQAGWSAHNGFGDFTIGPDTNAATPPGTASTNFYTTPPNSATWEKLCETCHVPSAPTQFKYVAGRWQGTDNSGIVLPSRHGVTSGVSSHLASDYGNLVYIQAQGNGVRTNNSYLRAGDGSTNLSTWGSVIAGLGSYSTKNVQSKYGNWAGGSPQNPTSTNAAYMICESCHNLLYNSADAPAAVTDGSMGYMNNLLVFRYADDGQGASFTNSSPAGGTYPTTPTGISIGDGLCRGCHGSAVIPANRLSTPNATDNTYVHYPAAHTVASAVYTYPTGLTPYGRSGTGLLTAIATCPETTTADKAGAPGVFTYPAAATLNCDSCHRPHNAEAKSTNGQAWSNANQGTVRRWILEPGSVTTDNLAKSQACTQCHDDQIMCGY